MLRPAPFVTAQTLLSGWNAALCCAFLLDSVLPAIIPKGARTNAIVIRGIDVTHIRHLLPCCVFVVLGALCNKVRVPRTTSCCVSLVISLLLMGLGLSCSCDWLVVQHSCSWLYCAFVYLVPLSSEICNGGVTSGGRSPAGRFRGGSSRLVTFNKQIDAVGSTEGFIRRWHRNNRCSPRVIFAKQQHSAADSCRGHRPQRDRRRRLGVFPELWSVTFAQGAGVTCSGSEAAGSLIIVQ